MLACVRDPVARVAGHAALCIVDFCAGIEGESAEDSQYFHGYTDTLLGQLLPLLQHHAQVFMEIYLLMYCDFLLHMCCHFV